MGAGSGPLGVSACVCACVCVCVRVRGVWEVQGDTQPPPHVWLPAASTLWKAEWVWVRRGGRGHVRRRSSFHRLRFPIAHLTDSDTYIFTIFHGF